MKLNEEKEIQIAIANHCGKHCRYCNNTGFLPKMSDEEYERVKKTLKVPDAQPQVPCTVICQLPAYTSDLNACHEFEVRLTEKLQQVAYEQALMQILNRDHDGEHRFIGASHFHFATATANQRCRAFLEVVNRTAPRPAPPDP